MEQEVAVLFAMQKGYFDDVPVDKVKDCQSKMLEYLTTRKQDVLAMILDKLTIDKELEEKLHSAIKDFKSSYKP